MAFQLFDKLVQQKNSMEPMFTNALESGENSEIEYEKVDIKPQREYKEMKYTYDEGKDILMDQLEKYIYQKRLRSFFIFYLTSSLLQKVTKIKK
jgi:hypothetical protein